MECSDCGGEGHRAGWPYCPGKIMRKTESKHAPIAKKPWVKPTLTRWVKAVDNVDKAYDPVDKSGNVDTVVDKKEARKKYQREWLQRKRANG